MQAAEPLRRMLLRNVLLPAGDLIFGQRMISRLRFLERAQWWDAQRVREERDRALRKLIRTAYAEVAFYRDLFNRGGVTPDQVNGAADLRRIPVVTKQMLRAAYPASVTRATGRRTFESSTSGSTGTNFRVLTDTETSGWWRASLLLALEWAGWHIGEPHLQTGMNLNRSWDRRLKDRLMGCHYASAFDLTDEHLDQCLDAMDRKRISHLWGYPGSLYFLAQRAAHGGWNRQLKTVVTWGDNLYSHYRNTIERAFGVRVSDTYGCAEEMQIAAQCELASYHIHSLDVVVEFLDEQEMPVAAGQPGNIVVTRLAPGPMPLIRYRIGDLGAPAEAGSCACGRGFAVMQSISGRETDVVFTPSGNRLIVHFFTGILEHFPEIDSFQVVQEEIGSMVVRVVPATGFTTATCAEVVDRLKRAGAQDMRIDLERVPEIPLPASGKRRFVVSHVDSRRAGTAA